MHRVALILALGSCVLMMLCVVVPALAWIGERTSLVLSDATDVQVRDVSLARVQFNYRLPPHQTFNDVLRRLTSEGWSRDRKGERALRRDGMDDGNVLAIYWRHGWFGLVPEVVTIRGDAHDSRRVKIEIVRCVTIGPWMPYVQ
jgi:hypothetical protein